MSFTSDTKQELLTLPMTECCKLAELSALFAVNGHLSISSDGIALVFQTTSLPLARKVIQSLKKLYHIQVEVVSKKQVKLQKKSQYAVIVREKVHSVINELALMDETKGFAQSIDDTLLLKECDQRSFLKGAFLASGSINHPGSSSYHAEITVQSEGFAVALTELMNRFDLNTKYISKKKNYLVYIKESEKIADFLRIMGATYALLTFEDERIKRDFVNSITRVMNMELANQNKTLEAANRQLKHIAILENLVDMSKLPDTLNEAIFLRKTYPEASLVELSEFSKDHFNKSISKSGLNHRFRNISALAQEVLDDFNE
ncbi:MAG: DNA-binding protein WhiA [Candidatus Izemoplasmataceae bacterium]|jgi:cell division protein WhiA|uniref:DNA-binding protein WhiA n=1 Tax=Liberiplasma polymorphum TaxID=3374570 RepID=UPI003771D42A